MNTKKDSFNILYKKIPLASTHQLYLEKERLHIKGSLGWNALVTSDLVPNSEESFRIHSKNQSLHCLFPQTTNSAKTKFGSLRALIKNQLTGVQEAYVATLRLQGLGYKAFIAYLSQSQKKKNLPRNSEKILHTPSKELPQCLVLDLGFSHLISYKFPPEVFLFLPKPNIICLYGLEKTLVNQIAGEIKDFKKPEAYTGKGILSLDEIIHLKPGKKS